MKQGPEPYDHIEGNLANNPLTGMQMLPLLAHSLVDNSILALGDYEQRTTKPAQPLSTQSCEGRDGCSIQPPCLQQWTTNALALLNSLSPHSSSCDHLPKTGPVNILS